MARRSRLGSKQIMVTTESHAVSHFDFVEYCEPRLREERRKTARTADARGGANFGVSLGSKWVILDLAVLGWGIGVELGRPL